LPLSLLEQVGHRNIENLLPALEITNSQVAVTLFLSTNDRHFDAQATGNIPERDSLLLTDFGNPMQPPPSGTAGGRVSPEAVTGLRPFIPSG
jgi:hypothetical protein